MKILRFLGIIFYSGYLINVGLLLVILPWSRAWGNIVPRLPLNLIVLLDAPWIRGLISAFGLLHLLLLAWELVTPSAFPGISGKNHSS
ncbi:MAG: hypothetical protein ACC742_00870 [Thermoanaerobaculales bacterium]